MKRKLCLIIILITIFLFPACSANVESEKVENNPSKEVVTTETETNETSEEIEKNEEMEIKDVKTIKVPSKEIYVDYDSALRKKDEVYSILMYSSNDSLVGLAFRYDMDYTGTLKDVVELFKSDFINDAALSSRGDLYGCEIVVDSTEEVTIAERDSIRFTGSVLNKDTWQCHVYGYAFIIDGVPCAVIGLVSAEAQDADMIAETDALVDEIASTIRTTK